MLKTLCHFFCFFFLSLFLKAQNQALQSIDVQHYDLSFDFTQFEDYIEGSATITFIALENLKTVAFNFVASRTAKEGLQISEVSTNEEVSWKLKDDILIISKTTDFVKNEQYRITVKYSGKPIDGLIISKNQQGKPTLFADNWPNRAHYWFPCVDHPADKALVSFNVTYPTKYQLVANGLLVKDSSINKQIKYTVYQTTTPLPTKVMVLGMAEFAISEPCFSGQTAVTSWIFKNQEKLGFVDYAPACEILSWFTQNIGDYPFEKLANVQSKTRYGGMENASCIFYFEESVNGRAENETLIAHEIAHQWFSNSATEKDWPHLWLSEGFATYFTDLYVLSKYGKDTFNNRMAQERAKALAFYKRYQAPIVDSVQSNLNVLLNPNSYQKGAWVLHMLRHEIGDSLFWETIRAYYSQYQFSNAETHDFVKVVNAVSGQNLSPFFNQWLKMEGHPDLEISWKETLPGKVEITLLQKQKNLFEFTLEIYAKCENEHNMHIFNVKERKCTFTIEENENILDLEIDPLVKLFARYNFKKF